MFKHGRATEVRASDKYDKDDAEQILDWAEGTPMHGRYAHVTETDEAERILRKHGYEPEEGGDTVEQHPCPRCGQVIDANADYCPNCSLRQTDGRPRWWRIYRDMVAEDDPVFRQYDDDLPPASLAQLPPGYYEHALDVFSAAAVISAAEEVPVPVDDVHNEEFVADDPEIDSDDMDWLSDNILDIEEQHRERHPGSTDVRAVSRSKED